MKLIHKADRPAILALLALLAIGCGEDRIVTVEVPKVVICDCPDQAGVYSEAWEAYCEDGIPKARVTLILILRLVDNAETMVGYITAHGDCGYGYCTPGDNHPMTITRLEGWDNLFTATAEGFTYDCMSGPGNFARTGRVGFECCGKFKAVSLPYACSENTVTLDPIDCTTGAP